MNDKTKLSTATLLLRLSLGIIFVSHAGLKYFVFSLAGTVQFFSSVGFPGWLAYVVFTVELLGGILLIVGFQTRKIAIVLIPVLLGATYVHFPNGWLFSYAGGGWEYPLFLALTTVIVAILGDGSYTLKSLYERNIE